ncbi:MAG TPA: hypothetical protein PLG96_08805 [Flexilinea sp.]|nr:hypothetical protein [Flexilinea sp.]
MSDSVATAVAHPNIAFIKYWGNRDDSLRLPANGSISMNLGALETRTTVVFSSAYRSDRVSVNGSLSEGESLIRVVHFMDRIRSRLGKNALRKSRAEIIFRLEPALLPQLPLLPL